MSLPAPRAFPARAALALVLAVLLLPLALAEVPPLLDYPNHLARAVILAGQAPELATYYAADWRLLPNLAFDLLMLPLLQLLGPHEAGRLVLGLAAALGVLGSVAYHRAVFGRSSWWPLGSALVAWHGLLLMGFVSFSLGVGLALLAASLAITSGGRPSLARLAGIALLATGVALSHLFAFGFLGLLLLAHEAGRILGGTRPSTARLGLWFRWAVALLPGTLIALQAFTSTGEGLLLWQYGDRLRRLAAGFAGYHVWLDRLAPLVVLLVIGAAAWMRRLAVDPGSLIAAAVCAMLYLAVPAVLGGGAFAEVRFAIFLGFLLFAGLDVRLGWPAALPLAALGAARLAVLGLTWHLAQTPLQELRAALAPVPAGGRIFTVAPRRDAAPAYFRNQRGRAVVSFLYEWPDSHLGGHAILERRAAWPALFAIAGQQPLRRLAPFERFSSQPWHTLPPPAMLDPARPPPPAFAADHAAWADWPARFDYVLLLHADATPRAPEFATAPLALVVDTGFAALYRVLR
jgi:hypothetical protein